MRSNRSMPSSTVIPELAYPDIEEAATWLGAAFGFTVRLQIGTHRAQLNVGDGAVVLTEWRREGHRDAELAHARDGPCRTSAEDLAGHRWTFSQTIADVNPTDWGGTPG